MAEQELPVADDVATEQDYERFARHRIAEIGGDAEAFGLSYNVLHLAYVMITDYEALVHREQGWTMPGFRLMFKLWILGPTQPARLADLSGTTRSAMSNLINTLERAGLVERRRDDHDRRVVFVALTEEGRTAVSGVFPHQNAREARWFDVLDPAERAQMVELIRRVVAARPD
ncbi:MarR family winged helix-turn-helix transcriptional regulator [Saccharothrix obliqua]|uniref:MarR family winged helix-turn-helix transcriptional regulator n=1 Tax=Saccharothrix obliqua TaxID=2861747 RepID=UPI001C5F2AD8|nr:MarR family winged helix-turn-helix transcriptional regulator [Saccharothrix obliqua]MBW4721284.1 MarR family winged helix-turn-helix transcriptional regulator [Saccharothrix obliqua]